jgi:hypothetical protein
LTGSCSRGAKGDGSHIRLRKDWPSSASETAQVPRARRSASSSTQSVSNGHWRSRGTARPGRRDRCPCRRGFPSGTCTVLPVLRRPRAWGWAPLAFPTPPPGRWLNSGTAPAGRLSPSRSRPIPPRLSSPGSRARRRARAPRSAPPSIWWRVIASPWPSAGTAPPGRLRRSPTRRPLPRCSSTASHARRPRPASPSAITRPRRGASFPTS